MNKYRKLIAAVLGLGLLVFSQNYGLSVPGINGLVLELIIAALTSFGVYQVSNET